MWRRCLELLLIAALLLGGAHSAAMALPVAMVEPVAAAVPPCHAMAAAVEAKAPQKPTPEATGCCGKLCAGGCAMLAVSAVAPAIRIPVAILFQAPRVEAVRAPPQVAVAGPERPPRRFV
ncbi:hypothetical protein [Sandaracinobacteroides saxicola]|uniref:CopL family metal-binding regulatory protein n=1 Tax=Sandaracinobacteroides saxicola TaxID=2759707 RepID=A0A7G5IKM5_9SPHN|nr:hypothetical protein [Sandaracinobacteroides saxicola]QMW23917.1 hypothetical protein H3309_05445 [Sandaracinobacteroides saxicola]